MSGKLYIYPLHSLPHLGSPSVAGLASFFHPETGVVASPPATFYPDLEWGGPTSSVAPIESQFHPREPNRPTFFVGITFTPL